MSQTQVKESILVETLLPKDTNAAGHVFGGVVMSLMDKCAAVAAWRFAKKRVVTASADNITFHTPIYVGEVLHASSRIIYTGRSSMDISVKVEVEDIFAESLRTAVTGIFTMVAVDDQGKPTSIPTWEPQTEEERHLYQIAIDRRKSKGL